MNTEFLQNEIFGNWQLRNDSILILDSNPQRSRLVVKEHFKKGKKNNFSSVKDFEEISLIITFMLLKTKETLLLTGIYLRKLLLKKNQFLFI